MVVVRCLIILKNENSKYKKTEDACKKNINLKKNTEH
jgi:hypothetical protein